MTPDKFTRSASTGSRQLDETFQWHRIRRMSRKA